VIAHAFHHNAFLIVSNGDNARYGSITSTWEHFGEWKRLDERDKGSVAAEVLLNGMLAKDRLLDIVENFILFDASKAGSTRKVVARNHQVLGVNQAVAAVVRQEELKRQFPPGERLRHRVIELPMPDVDVAANDPGLAQLKVAEQAAEYAVERKDVPSKAAEMRTMQLVERAHPDLGRLGVVWHTQGSGKSYSMAFSPKRCGARWKATLPSC
jgi:Type I site-specific restriction-modification system, R (restriction) subunit and related helicases